MTKISGKVILVKPVPLSRAAKVITIFASVDNGSSPAVSTYLKRTADAFSRLVNFHGSKSIINSSDVERNQDLAEEQHLKFRETEEEKSADLVVDEGNKKKKIKRKEKSGKYDTLNEKTSSKSIKTGDVERNSNAAEDQHLKVKEEKIIDLIVEEGQNNKKKRKKRKDRNGEDDNLNEQTSKKKRRSSPNS